PRNTGGYCLDGMCANGHFFYIDAGRQIFGHGYLGVSRMEPLLRFSPSIPRKYDVTLSCSSSSDSQPRLHKQTHYDDVNGMFRMSGDLYTYIQVSVVKMSFNSLTNILCDLGC